MSIISCAILNKISIHLNIQLLLAKQTPRTQPQAASRGLPLPWGALLGAPGGGLPGRARRAREYVFETQHLSNILRCVLRKTTSYTEPTTSLRTRTGCVQKTNKLLTICCCCIQCLQITLLHNLYPIAVQIL